MKPKPVAPDFRTELKKREDGNNHFIGEVVEEGDQPHEEDVAFYSEQFFDHTIRTYELGYEIRKRKTPTL